MSSIANNENEELAVLHVAIFLVPVALTAIGGWLAAQSVTAAAWLIGHQVMVAPAQALIPVTEHAGLDLVRIIAAVAISCTLGFGIARFKPHPRTTTR